MSFDKNEYQRQYQNEQNRKNREIVIRECANIRRRSARLKDPLKFLKGYFANRFYRPFSKDQIEAIHIIIDCATYGSDEIIAAPRGEWKTETTKALVVYLMLKQIIKFPVIIGATAGDAKLKFEDIKKHFENPDLAEDFPEVCDPIIALDGTPSRAGKQTFGGIRTDFEWKAEHCLFPQVLERPGWKSPSPYGDCAMTYRGLDGAIRGINLFGRRPDLAFCDDLETRESANSDYQINIRNDLLDKDVGGLAGGGEKLTRIVLGTVQNYKCLTKRKLDEWGGRRYQGVYSWPDRTDLRDEYVELRRSEKRAGSKTFPKSYKFYAANQTEIERGGELASPHNYSTKKRRNGQPVQMSGIMRIYDEIADKDMDYVLTEIQNDPREEDKPATNGLTAAIVASRLSGLPVGKVPLDSEMISVGLDIGKYYSHWTAIAWSGNAIGRVIDYGIMETPGMQTATNTKAVELALVNSLMNWRNDLEVFDWRPDIVAIDSGDYTDAVYGFIRAIGGGSFIATKGWDSGRWRGGKASNTRLVGDRWFATVQPEAGIWLYNIDVDYWKEWVHERFLTPTFDTANAIQDGSLSLFVDATDPRRHISFSHHICAEEIRETFTEGKGLVRKWHNKNKNNHWLDSTVLACAGANMKGVRLRASGVNVESPQNHKPRKPIVSNSAFRGPGGQPFFIGER